MLVLVGPFWLKVVLKLPACKRVLNKSLPVKLVSKLSRTRLLNTAWVWSWLLPSVTVPLVLVTEAWPPQLSAILKITSPLSLVVVENWLFSKKATRCSRLSTLAPKAASSLSNSWTRRFNLSISSLSTPTPSWIKRSMTFKQAFKPAANSQRVVARSPRKVRSGKPTIQP